MHLFKFWQRGVLFANDFCLIIIIKCKWFSNDYDFQMQMIIIYNVNSNANDLQMIMIFKCE